VVVSRFKAQLNENAKTLASSHLLPEMNHNEIVGWQNPERIFKDFMVILFGDKDMHPQVKKRMVITKEILNKENIPVLEILSRGNSLLSRIFSSIYIGDFISFYLAILYGVDPTPVDRIAFLKKRLSKT
jgi:glucose/mannose-6-phosphate isomerase